MTDYYRAIYGQRRRQILAVLIVACVWGVITTFSLSRVPAYFNPVVASDGENLYFTSQVRTFQPDVDEFFVAMSRDGRNFSDRKRRSGACAGAVVRDGELYCLFEGGDVARITGEKWTPLPTGMRWHARGIAKVDGQVMIFGQDKELTKIRTGILEGDKWKPGPDFPYSGGPIKRLFAVSKGSERFLLWTEFPVPPKPGSEADETEPEEPEAAEDADKVVLHLAKITSDALVMLPSTSFDMAVHLAPVGDDDGLRVFFAEKWISGRFGFDWRIKVVDYQQGQWQEPRLMQSVSNVYAVPRGLAAADFGGMTYVYTVDCAGGLLFGGITAYEFDGETLSQGFKVFEPVGGDRDPEALWFLSLVVSVSMFGGAVAAMSKVKMFDTQDKSSLGGLLYATVIDRGTAAGIDLAIVYTIVSFVNFWLRSGDFVLVFYSSFAVYCIVMERRTQGRTLGKMLLGLRVLREDGSPVGIRACVRRNLLKPLEMATIGVGFCLMSRRFQRPGDYLAGTVVVKTFRRLGLSNKGQDDQRGE